MKELELRYLAPYMPYNLRGFIITKNSQFEVYVVGWNYTTLNTSPSIHGFTNCPFDKFKPILRPLSDMVKPCLTEDKIPIVELAKIHLDWIEGLDYNLKCKYRYQRQINVTSIWNHPADKDPYFDDSLFIKTVNTHKNAAWINEKLFEWHFDVFGLINNGLAININEL